MKIGLILFGHLRSYRQTLSSFTKLKETLQESGQVDIFCHTWNIEESVTASWWKENKHGEIPPANVNEDEIKEKYQPVRYHIEPSRQFDDEGYNIKSAISVAGILSMLYSQRQAFKLLEQHSNENNVEYDVVIKSRYDLLYEIAPVFSNEVNDCITSNCLFLPTSNPYELVGCFSDVFAIGPMAMMKKYFAFFENFSEATQYYQQLGYSRFLPELCLTTFLKRKELDIRELTGLRIQILRASGEKFQINSAQSFEANCPLCFYRGTIQNNLELLPNSTPNIKSTTTRLVKKYLSWIKTDADEKTLQDYADFYNGKWIGDKKITRLAKNGKKSKIFTENVMKNFFEEAVRNAKYSRFKKLLLAIILYRHSGYGLFFFRVLGNIKNRLK